MSGFLFLISFVLAIFGFIALINPDTINKLNRKISKNYVDKTKGKLALQFFILAFIFFIIFAVSLPTPSGTTKEDSSKEVKTVTIGNPDQIQFHNNLKNYSKKYADQSNEIQKSAVYREVGEYLKKYLKNGKVEEWEGTLIKIGTTEGGKKLYISIKSDLEDFDIIYGTWNNELSDYSTGSMIPLGNPVYDQVAKLNEGDKIIFSAKFIPDNKKGFSEQSITESGFVDEPEYNLKFISIRKK
jgi:hypothetical protein